MRKVLCGLIFCLFCLLACYNKPADIKGTLQEWLGKEILFPVNDSINYEDMFIEWDYAVVSYLDSAGCFDCKLNFRKWKEVMMELRESGNKKIGCLLILQSPYTDRIASFMKWDRYEDPVYFDEENSFCKLNKLPSENMFHTYLLSKDHRIVAIGNPVLNPKVKELYQKIIQGKPLQDKDDKKKVQTTVSLDTTALSLGKFPWQEGQQTTFRLKNTGEKPLVIQDVVTSCGCLTVDYPQEPVQPGKEAVLRMTYKADNPGYFNKAATVYCNAENSPIRLRVSGNALEKG